MGHIAALQISLTGTCRENAAFIAIAVISSPRMFDERDFTSRSEQWEEQLQDIHFAAVVLAAAGFCAVIGGKS